ncbi:MAG: hypothetical protein IJ010_08890 [Ruminococcus sp.]|nr:hypothetical protein [Ruminococcus sp.]
MADNFAYLFDDDYSYDYSYDFSGEPDPFSDEASLPEQPDSETESEKNEKPVLRYRRTEAKKGSVIRIVFLSLLAVALLGSVIYSLDRRNTMYNKVASLNDKLELTEAENVRLQSELESRMSAKNVEEYAENVLGMQKIDPSQIEFIKIQTGDVVIIPEQKKSFFDKIGDFFEKCAEYFKG